MYLPGRRLMPRRTVGKVFKTTVSGGAYQEGLTATTRPLPSGSGLTHGPRAAGPPDSPLRRPGHQRQDRRPRVIRHRLYSWTGMGRSSRIGDIFPIPARWPSTRRRYALCGSCRRTSSYSSLLIRVVFHGVFSDQRMWRECMPTWCSI
jgi:hypothetical protein